MISLTFGGTDQALIARFRAKSGQIIQALARKLMALDFQLQAKIQGEKLQGQVLNQRTGKLAASVRALPIENDPGQLSGTVQAAGGPAFYGRIQEKGGTTDYDIVPVNKQALRFMLGGKEVFRRLVHHPPLPARPFMAPSLDEFTPEIVGGLREALHESMVQ